MLENFLHNGCGSMRDGRLNLKRSVTVTVSMPVTVTSAVTVTAVTDIVTVTDTSIVTVAVAG